MKKWILNLINLILSRFVSVNDNVKTFQDLEYKTISPNRDIKNIV